jgi:hypothetical protein
MRVSLFVFLLLGLRKERFSGCERIVDTNHQASEDSQRHEAQNGFIFENASVNHSAH